MKKSLLIIFTALVAFNASAQAAEWTRVEASELNLCGKAFKTPNPYHRIDTCVFKGFDRVENGQCRMSAGLTVLFRTDAPTIGVSVVPGQRFGSGSFRSYRGFDLYIKKDGKWLWAGCNEFPIKHNDPDKVFELVTAMAPGVKECLLYLPIHSELKSVKVCVPAGNTVEPLESPFRHKIVFHGSSFTHGISTTRAGMSYPMQFMRKTGMQVIPLGFSGHCKMQPYFATVLENVEADAYVFDPFSNPQAPLIKERLFPFIERMVKAHPGKPLIFQRTIYWERDNFNLAHRQQTLAKQAMSDSLMKIATKKYKDVYYIVPDAALHNGESSTADGTHPNDNGYSLWEASIEKPILRILRKYGIK